MSDMRLIVVVAVAALCTFATRLFPFVIFGARREVPDFVRYLGDILPMAIIGVLIVYCLKGCMDGDISYIAPQLIAVAATAVMHLWRRNALLSIGVGTIGYMLMIHFVFV